MAGGIGSRFWPMSTPQRPKQFLDVLGIGKSLLQMTYERLLNVAPKENIYIVTNENYFDLVKYFYFFPYITLYTVRFSFTIS